MHDEVPRYVRTSDETSAMLDGEAVVLQLATGFYYSLDGVAVRVWELLAEPRSIEEIVTVLCGEFDVERARCLVDVSRLMEELVGLRLAERLEGRAGV